MLAFKSNVLFFTFFNAFVEIPSLVQLIDDNSGIAITEMVIRDTINNIFSLLGVRDVKHKPRLKDFLTMHNFFVTITMKDCDNLRNIARLTRVNGIDNNTVYFIAQINEVLNEDDKSYEATDNIYVTTYIEALIEKLRKLKEKYNFNRNFANLTINSKILKVLNSDEESVSNNNTRNVEVDKAKESDSILNDNEHEVWRPTEESGRRIYQGQRTRIKYFPFMASVQFFKKFQCAGSIIQRDLVITAASCLQLAWNNRFFRENPAFLSVQIGSDFYEGGGENIPIFEVYFHPDYSPRDLKNNLAIMRMSIHIYFRKNRHVRRIEIDEHDSPMPVNTFGITFVGWGAKDTSNFIVNPWHNKLSFAELDFYPLPECQEVYSKEYVTFKHFCAGFFSKGIGACHRDIGGPGIVNGYLVGVASFGPPNCGTVDAPTVFTKVGYYKKWIRSVMELDVPSGSRLTTRLITTATYPPSFTQQPIKHFSLLPIVGDKRSTGSYIFPKESMRILKGGKLFKDFIATMFGEEDYNEYDDFGSLRDLNGTVTPPEPSTTTESMIREEQQQDETQTDSVLLRTDEPKSTKLMSLESSSSSSNETDLDGGLEAEIIIEDPEVEVMRNNGTRNDKNLYITDENVSYDEETKLENDITNLLDNLDLQKLLESDEILDHTTM